MLGGFKGVLILLRNRTDPQLSEHVACAPKKVKLNFLSRSMEKLNISHVLRKYNTKCIYKINNEFYTP